MGCNTSSESKTKKEEQAQSQDNETNKTSGVKWKKFRVSSDECVSRRPNPPPPPLNTAWQGDPKKIYPRGVPIPLVLENPPPRVYA
ncbi:hypothetical protein RR46_13264 [Papilio xuthus]|uniref:Uncharacterized protein n=1 Tax=Papilio xuthus TaxID=66420 RepID=A0A194PMZ1_PAPXU|nr:hypothetical protein RR46_13264 [Papilio xuthus]